GGGEVRLARRESDLARFLAVHVHDGEGVHVLNTQSDATAGPPLGDGDLTLIPGCRDTAQVRVLPARMDVERLAVLLDVAGLSGPKPGDLEIAPPLGRHEARVLPGRLPAPQAVDANALARGGLFPIGLAQVPDDLTFKGERRRRYLCDRQSAQDQPANAEELAPIHRTVTPLRDHSDLLHRFLPSGSLPTELQY